MAILTSIIDKLGHIGYDLILAYNNMSDTLPMIVVFLIGVLTLALPVIAIAAGFFQDEDSIFLRGGSWILRAIAGWLVMEAVYSFSPDIGGKSL